MRTAMIRLMLAVVLGVSTMILPLYVWHQINYPERTFTLLNIRQEALELETYDVRLESPATTPFCFILALSFIVSAIAYAVSRRLV
jgi:uncharacterized membrane protein